MTHERNFRLLNKKFREMFFPTLLASIAGNFAILVDALIVSILLGSLNLSVIQSIEPTAGMVQKGERIIDRGVIVTHDIYRILKSYEKKTLRTEGKFDKSLYVLGGESIMVIIIYSFLYLFLALFRRRIFNNIRQLSLLMLMVLK